MSSSAVHKPPGEVVTIGEQSVQIAAKGGIVKIGKLRVDKGDKIGPVEFAKSTGAKVGDRLGNE